MTAPTLNRTNPPNAFHPRVGHFFAIETEDHGDVVETRTLDARTWGTAKAEARDLFASPRCSDATLSVFVREWDGDDCMGEIQLRAGLDPDCNCDDCGTFNAWVCSMGRLAPRLFTVPAEPLCGICWGPRGTGGVRDLCWPCGLGQYGDGE